MNNHISQLKVFGNITNERVKVEKLNSLIRKDRKIDLEILDSFPLNTFGESTDEVLVDGSDDLLKAFEKISDVKMDFTEALKDIEYVGLTDEKEIILRFKNEEYGEPFNGTGIYDFTYDFLDSLFEMGRFSKFCIKNSYTDLLNDNISKLIDELPETKRQYRFLKKENKMLLRGLTSTRYNNYDNNLALYLTLYSLHHYAKEYNTSICLQEAHLTDSEISIFFKQNDPIRIANVGNLHFGMYTSNNEIREGTFSLELRYTLEDKNGKSFSGLSDSVFQINHSNGIENISRKLSNTTKIREIREITMNLIKNVKLSTSLTDDSIYFIFQKVLNSTQKLGSETRSKAREIKERIDNTMTIVEAFDKLKDISTNIDERIHLERLYNEILKELN
ncbi:hypothetical protein LG329_16645 [Virgibacillus necropolis]|uniref:hypothetical protein n=1 Tax=Virgibacillus necropolis TaxID=163877 RepID=UPI00384AC929